MNREKFHTEEQSSSLTKKDWTFVLLLSLACTILGIIIKHLSRGGNHLQNIENYLIAGLFGFITGTIIAFIIVFIKKKTSPPEEEHCNAGECYD